MLEETLQKMQAEITEMKNSLNDSKEQNVALDKKYHKAKKLIKDLQARWELGVIEWMAGWLDG